MRGVGLTDMTRAWTAIGIALAAMLAGTPRASACSCLTVGPGEADYRQALGSAEAVFRGTVREVQELTSLGLRIVVFDADAAWAGIKAERVFVFTGNGGGDCGFSFEVGKAYVVWAKRDDWRFPDELSTSICSFTAPLESATDQLAQLGKPKRIKP